MPRPDSGPPPIPLALVEFLEGVYPDRFPSQVLGTDPHAISADLHRHAGRLEVVRFLREHHARQRGRPESTPTNVELP